MTATGSTTTTSYDLIFTSYEETTATGSTTTYETTATGSTTS